MFERFTERARQVVVSAQDEALRLRHNYIGTEHILLGLLREDEGLAARVLQSFDLNVQDVRAQVARIVGQGDEVATGMIPFTPRTKKVLELSLREAIALGHNYIGTEHILLGLARVNDGVAARILRDFEADAEKIRNEVIHMLSGPGRRRPAQPVDPTPEAASASPLASEFLLEIEKVRARKEEAIEAQRFERAAALRDLERKLLSAARDGDLERFRREVRDVTSVLGLEFPDESAREPRPGPSRIAVALAAVAFPLGVLVGWLIWG